MAEIQSGKGWAPVQGAGRGWVARQGAKLDARANAGRPKPNANPLLSQAQQLANLQTQPALHALAQQLAASNLQTQGTMKLAGGYYNQLGQQAQQGVTDEQNIANALNQQLQGIAGSTNSQLQGIGQNAQSSLLAHSPGDSTLSQAALGSLASEMARQQGLAAQSQGAQQAFGANQGANYSGLAGTGLATNALAGTQALKGIAQSGTVKNEPLLQKMADLRSQHGALVATNLGKLQQQATNNLIAEQGLGIKQNAINAENLRARNSINAENTRSTNSINAANTRAQNALNAANTRAQNAINATNRRDTLDRQSRESIAAANRAARGGAGGSRPLPTSQNNKVLGSISKAIDIMKLWQHAGMHVTQDGTVIDGKTYKKGQVAPNPSNATIRATLGAAGYPDYVIQAALELKGWGFITPATARALHSHGIRGGTYNNAPIRVQMPPPNAANGYGDISPGGLNSPH